MGDMLDLKHQRVEHAGARPLSAAQGVLGGADLAARPGNAAVVLVALRFLFDQRRRSFCLGHLSPCRHNRLVSAQTFQTNEFSRRNPYGPVRTETRTRPRRPPL